MEAQVKAWTDILTNTLQPKLQALEAERDAHVRAVGEYADLVIMIGALRARRDGGGGCGSPHSFCPLALSGQPAPKLQ